MSQCVLTHALSNTCKFNSQNIRGLVDGTNDKLLLKCFSHHQRYVQSKESWKTVDTCMCHIYFFQEVVCHCIAVGSIL